MSVTRPARELDAGDVVWIAGRWRTIEDVLPGTHNVRLIFDDGVETWAPVWAGIACAA